MKSKPSMRRPIRLVEIVGPPGAGKTTLGHMLSQCSEIELVDRPPYFRNMRNVPFFARNTLRLLPAFLRLYRGSHCRSLTAEEIVWMVTLQGWPQVLRQQIDNDNKVIVLDEGPLCYMAFLQVYGPAFINSEKASVWWASTYERWATAVDMEVWLDAPDPLLVKRIRARAEWHGVKAKSDPDAYQYLDALRRAYDRLLPDLLANNHELKVLYFDTGRRSLDQIRSQVMEACDLPSREGAEPPIRTWTHKAWNHERVL